MSLQSIWDLCTGSTVGTGGDLAVKTLRFLLAQHFLHSAVASPVVHVAIMARLPAELPG